MKVDRSAEPGVLYAISRRVGLWRIGTALLMVAAIAGCATGPPDVGSRDWHAQRIAEIEDAYARGELTAEQYLSLKNEADSTRAEYRAALRSYPPYYYYPSPFFFNYHHFHHHH